MSACKTAIPTHLRRKPVKTKFMANSQKSHSRFRFLITTLSLCVSVGFCLSVSAEDKPTGTGQVLDPNNYVGQVKAGYAAAKEIPEICAKLFCYCGCDLTDCHGSLLDCFTSDHGVDCHICQEESILALSFHRKGKSLSDIQKYIDKRYAKEYPFEVESPVLQKYKKERLWDAGKKASTDSTSSASNKKSKTRSTDASCCGDKKSD